MAPDTPYTQKTPKIKQRTHTAPSLWQPTQTYIRSANARAQLYRSPATHSSSTQYRNTLGTHSPQWNNSIRTYSPNYASYAKPFAMERCLDTGTHYITCLQCQSPRTLSPMADELCQDATHQHHQNNWNPHHHLHPQCMETQAPRCHPNTPPHPKTPTPSSLRPRTTRIYILSI